MSECDREASTMRNPGPLRAVKQRGKRKKAIIFGVVSNHIYSLVETSGQNPMVIEINSDQEWRLLTLILEFSLVHFSFYPYALKYMNLKIYYVCTNFDLNFNLHRGCRS